MRVLRMIVLGILVGLSCSYILVALSISQDAGAVMTGRDLFEQIIIAALLGAAIGPLSLILELERLPFLLQLALHLLSITALTLTAGYFGDWFEHFGITNVLISELIIYIIIWIMLMILQKKDIKQINKAIKQRKE